MILLFIYIFIVCIITLTIIKLIFNINIFHIAIGIILMSGILFAITRFGYDFGNKEFYLRDSKNILFDINNTQGLTISKLPEIKNKDNALTGPLLPAKSELNLNSEFFRQNYPDKDASFISVFPYYITVSVIEEFAKLFIAGILFYISLLIHKTPVINKKLVFITALIISSFSFFLIENILYVSNMLMYSSLAETIATFIIRTTNPVHFILLLLMGNYLLRDDVFTLKIRWRFFILFLLIAIIGHTLYNVFLTIGYAGITYMITVMTLIIPFSVLSIKFMDKIKCVGFGNGYSLIIVSIMTTILGIAIA